MKPTFEQPFQSKADQAREQALQAQYRSLGNPELVAVLQQQASAAARERKDGTTGRQQG